MTRRWTVLALTAALGLFGCGGADRPGDDDDDVTTPDAGVGPDAAPELKSGYIFDPAMFHSFEVEVSDADWQWLEDNALLEEYVPATVIFEGKRYEGAALRFKGGYGTLESCIDETTGELLCPKLSMKLSFTKFTDHGRFFGLRKLNFHSSVRDPSMMREFIGYWMFREMGVPAPRASHAKLTVNGEYLGVFNLVEQVDEELIQDFWADDEGNLYKSVWPQWDTAAPYVEALENNEDVADVSRMMAFYSAIQTATDETFVSTMDGTLDMDAMARYFAVDRAISNVDGIKGFYCYGADATECTNSNYYWYEDPQGGINLLPWDLDYTFGDVNRDLGRKYADNSAETCQPVPFCLYWQWDECDPSVEDVYLLPPQCDRLYGMMHRATWDGYIDALAELAAGPLSRDVVVPKVRAERDKIRAAVIDDPYGPGPFEFDAHNDWVDQVLEEQLTEVETLLQEEGR